MKALLISLVLLTSTVKAWSQSATSFYLKDRTLVKLKPINHFEKLEIRTSKNTTVQTIDRIEQPIDEKRISLTVEDYNFDGFKDFSLSHSDDGMGVYTVYQVFLYNSNTSQFEPLEIPAGYTPVCECFCDLRIDKKRKVLYSSCRGGARWHTDVWAFDKNKKLKLLKSSKF